MSDLLNLIQVAVCLLSLIVDVLALISESPPEGGDAKDLHED